MIEKIKAARDSVNFLLEWRIMSEEQSVKLMHAREVLTDLERETDRLHARQAALDLEQLLTFPGEEFSAGEWHRGARLFLSRSKRIHAIKHCRDITQLGLKEAKDLVSTLREEMILAGELDHLLNRE